MIILCRGPVCSSYYSSEIAERKAFLIDGSPCRGVRLGKAKLLAGELMPPATVESSRGLKLRLKNRVALSINVIRSASDTPNFFPSYFD